MVSAPTTRPPISPGAEQVADLCGNGTFIGYSMGGRFALLAALARPDVVERLVLIGATAGLTTGAEREARGSLDDERARRVEALGVDAFVSEWLQGPMFEGLPDDPGGLEHRRRNTVAGLTGSLRSSGTGRQPSVWPQLDRIRVPALVIAGERDTKFVTIGRDLAAALPRGSLATIPGAGHAAHVEAPNATIDCIAEFLTSG